MRLAAPGWRYLGAVLSWGLFALCFALLYRGAVTVMGLGGFCASGGPYVIEVECPAEITATMPLSIFGGLAAVAIGVFLARGFTASLSEWAWPVLFVGLGIAFGLSGLAGDVTGIVIGILFIAMGSVPFVLALRAAPRALFIGTSRSDDTPFVPESTGRSPIIAKFRPTYDPDHEPVRPSAGDWVRGVGVPAVSAAVGVWGADAILTALLSGAA